MIYNVNIDIISSYLDVIMKCNCVTSTTNMEKKIK
jgi:hypothetical protein